MQTATLTLPREKPVGQVTNLSRLAIGLFVLCIAAGLVVGVGAPLRLIYPALALATGAYLFFRQPASYVSFTWWLWMLTPFVARLVDWQSAWDEKRLMIVAPYLVTLLSVVTLWRNARQLAAPAHWPFLLVLAALLYGLGLGLLLNEPFALASMLLEWLAPVLFAFHLVAQPERYDEFKQATLRTFLYGVLLMSIYGIVQYLFAPAWDQHWLIQTDIKSFGRPEPLGIRVWSTMNAPGPFSITLLAGLILLAGQPSRWRWPALVTGYLALLLTLARTAWVAWAVGFFFFLAPLEARRKAQILAVCLVLCLCVVPLALSEPFAELLQTRFQTFNNLRDDGSLNERLDIYKRGLAAVLARPLGAGLGRVVGEDIIDSAFLDGLLTLGWLGAALYFGGLALLLLRLFFTKPAPGDSFHTAVRAVSFGITPTLLMASQMIEATGMVYWGLLAFALVAPQHTPTGNAHQPPVVFSACQETSSASQPAWRTTFPDTR